ncbi:methyltransferase domain-containing protein [Colwellia sp. 1_MG-2023]|uniref:tRNA (guanine(46)-N(7))-methyltransferase TrmB n=1 Tax=Colwellia sp. 1_MG-2023 TaxID=3062649 RepID=UPI0026E2BFB1|nr:methyltransferase domain-containing protein [Colwellia sp. 1_MG-2023]MDO6445162.1 methyltransferase domain-containing protein [Colwellia sp. 1_MG-2023]
MTDNNKPLGDSKAIVTNQPGIHEKLAEIVQKHLTHPSKKPFQAHTLEAFELANSRVLAHQGEVILDSCCGVGQSTRLLAKQNPQALVIGVDKSAHRIERNDEELTATTNTHGIDNFMLVRADLNDFYRLVKQAKWPVSQHYILYPNPWPKAKHIQRRWHGSAVFPEIIAIGKEIVLRSNWRLYLEEFQFSAEISGRSGIISQVKDNQPLTPFEAKYQLSGQVCWQLTIK